MKERSGLFGGVSLLQRTGHRLMLSFIVSFAFCILLALPTVAFADELPYTVDELSSEIEISPDASMHVVERQIVTFEEKNEGLVWYLHAPVGGESVKISSVRAVPVGEDGNASADWVRLQLVDCKPAAQGLNPGDSASGYLRGERTRPWYSYSPSDGMVRTYFPAENETYLVETDYVVRNGVDAYRDVGELYWRFAHGSVPNGLDRVTLRVVLPVPEGESVVLGDNVFAWAHGSDEMAISLDETGAVVYHADSIGKGHYADAHVIFPANWLSEVTSNSTAYKPSMRRSYALEEEKDWVDSITRRSIWDNEVRVLFVAIAVVIVLVGVIVAVRSRPSARSRRSLIRTACTLGVVAMAEQLFFREPLTTGILVAAALVVGLGALALPQEGEEEEYDEDDEDDEDGEDVDDDEDDEDEEGKS